MTKNPAHHIKWVRSNKFSEVFEIPVSELGVREIIIHISVDLVSHGYGPNVIPNARVIRQREY